jgi:5-methylcytosine-specific restriction protein A
MILGVIGSRSLHWYQVYFPPKIENEALPPSSSGIKDKKIFSYELNMPTGTYKDAHVCECGYNTFHRGNWSTHKRTCKLVITSDKESIGSLQKQLAAKDEQLAAKDEQIVDLMKIVRKMIEVHTPAPISRGTAKGTKRKKMTEPQRRKIALRQNFKCANPDDKCKLTGSFEEYDVDHVIPLFLDGDDEEWNMQALCPACHRRKTENEVLQAPNGSG